MIEIFYGVKDIKINKVSKMPSEKPFMYKGTTFVPLRFVADALGQPVKWDPKNQTVWIGQSEEATLIYPEKGIEYMNFQKGYGSNEFEYHYDSVNPIKDNVGNEYSSYTRLYVSGFASKDEAWSRLEFPLNGQYKSFKAKIGLTDKYKNTQSELKMTISLDGVKAYEQKFVAGAFPEDVNIDVKNAKQNIVTAYYNCLLFRGNRAFQCIFHKIIKTIYCCIDPIIKDSRNKKERLPNVEWQAFFIKYIPFQCGVHVLLRMSLQRLQ